MNMIEALITTFSSFHLLSKIIGCDLYEDYSLFSISYISLLSFSPCNMHAGRIEMSVAGHAGECSQDIHWAQQAELVFSLSNSEKERERERERRKRWERERDWGYSSYAEAETSRTFLEWRVNGNEAKLYMDTFLAQRSTWLNLKKQKLQYSRLGAPMNI
jgi:hypothetical protein